jgi:hypothetical protein
MNTTSKIPLETRAGSGARILPFALRDRTFPKKKSCKPVVIDEAQDPFLEDKALSQQIEDFATLGILPKGSSTPAAGKTGYSLEDRKLVRQLCQQYRREIAVFPALRDARQKEVVTESQFKIVLEGMRAQRPEASYIALALAPLTIVVQEKQLSPGFIQRGIANHLCSGKSLKLFESTMGVVEALNVLRRAHSEEILGVEQIAKYIQGLFGSGRVRTLFLQREKRSAIMLRQLTEQSIKKDLVTALEERASARAFLLNLRQQASPLAKDIRVAAFRRQISQTKDAESAEKLRQMRVELKGDYISVRR